MIPVFVVCFAFWLVLSGHWDAFHLALGVAAALLVAAANRDDDTVGRGLRALPRLVAYLPWLLREIARSNVQVVRVVLDPRLPVDPVVVRLRPGLASDLALTTLANSITLTPGTVTLDVEGGELVVHALTAASGADLREGTMARRVAQVFGERGP